MLNNQIEGVKYNKGFSPKYNDLLPERGEMPVHYQSFGLDGLLC